MPFIDLLSTCICFLLVTAVWMQIGALQIKQSRGTDAPEKANPFDLDVHFSGARSMILQFRDSGKTIKKVEFTGVSFAALVADMDTQLDGLIAAAQGKKKEDIAAVANARTSPVGAGMITLYREVPYGDLVRVIDVLRKHHIINLGVIPAGG